MRKTRIALLLAIFFIFSAGSSLATTTLELSEKLEAIEYTGNGESYVDAAIDSAKADILDMTYPVGSIYITDEDLSTDDMHDTFGGKWERLTNTFLYATSENIGETGGSETYKLSAAIGGSDLSYVPYGEVYPFEETLSLSGTISTASGSFTSTIPVIEGTSRSVNVMPSYTAVRMFKRIS